MHLTDTHEVYIELKQKHSRAT